MSLLKSLWSIMLFMALAALSAQITGTVVDDLGPIEGAEISVLNTEKKVLSNEDGTFLIDGKVGDKLKVVNPITLSEVTVDVLQLNMGEINIVTNEVQLEVVTSFGTQKKESVVGSITSIKPEDLRVPSANLSNSFAGRVSGVIAYQRSGEPGRNASDFYIRGISTISGVSSPLIILDGVQVSSGDLNSIDPDVIESFSVLKDATATALYGTRGANGVMIITTKSGANLNKPKINFRLESYVNTPTSVPKMVSGAEYMRLFNEASDNLSSGVARFTEDQINGTENALDPYIYPNVNWYNELFKNSSHNQKVNFNIRGGGKKLDYFMSGTYNHETGMLRGRSTDFFSFDNNINIHKFSFQNNINAHLSDYSKISLRLNTQLTNSRRPSVSSNDLFQYAIRANPVDFPIMFPKDSTVSYVRWGAFSGSNVAPYNPLASLVSGYSDSFSSMVIATLEFNQKFDFLVKGLSFNALATFKNWSSTTANRVAPYNTFRLTSFSKLPNGGYDYSLGLLGTESNIVLNSTSGTSGDRRLYMQGILNYNRSFNSVHNFDVALIYNQDEFNLNNLGASTSYGVLVNSLPRRKQGVAGRINYNYDQKYLIEVNAGYNGSENFAPGKRWGFFPSVALGYNLSQEDYFASLKNVIQDLKVRASWGLVGNDQIGGDRFLYLANINLYNRGFTTGIDQNYNLNGPSYDRFQNNNLTWEVGEKIDIGLESRLFNSLSLNFDIFQEIRRNIFQRRGTIANYLGTSSTIVYGNTAEVKNKGFEASVNYTKNFNRNLRVDFQGSFTYVTNEILKYDEPSFQEYPNLKNVGRSLYTHLGYVAEGLFYDWAEVNNRAKQLISGNVAPGDIKYKDIPNIHGVADGQIDSNDRVYMGYPTVPEIIYGFGPNVQYKKWDFGLYFQGVAHTSLAVNNISPFGTNARDNVLQWIADSHWSPSNQDVTAAHPRLTKNDHANNTVVSSYWLRNGAFLKLKNAEIGYTYKNMRFYISGVNLLTFSKFKLWDPEQGGGNGLRYPTQRTFNAGFKMTIN